MLSYRKEICPHVIIHTYTRTHKLVSFACFIVYTILLPSLVMRWAVNHGWKPTLKDLALYQGRIPCVGHTLEPNITLSGIEIYVQSVVKT
jgi:hypothetical protein